MAIENTNREDVRSFLQSIFDAIDKDINIEIVKDIDRVDDLITQEIEVEGTYVFNEETFTICMIDDFLGTFEPLKDKNIITYTVPIVILANTEAPNEYFTKLKNAMEEFVSSLVGNYFQVNASLGYATNCTEYTNTEVRFDINGVEYIKWLVTVFLTKTDGVIVGNQVEYGIRLLDSTPDAIIGTNITKAEGLDDSDEQTLILSQAEFIINLTINLDILQDSSPAVPPANSTIAFDILLDDVPLDPQPTFDVNDSLNVYVIEIKQNVKLGITYSFTTSDELTDFEVKTSLIQASFTDDFNEIIPLLRGPSKVFQMETAQPSTDNEVGSIPKQGQYANELGFYLEKGNALLKEFIKLVEQENYDNDVIYELNTAYFDDIDLNFIRKFIITSGAIDPSLGSFVFVRITIAKPHPILVT
jgi:hypothetical protein